MSALIFIDWPFKVLTNILNINVTSISKLENSKIRRHKDNGTHLGLRRYEGRPCDLHRHHVAGESLAAPGHTAEDGDS